MASAAASKDFVQTAPADPPAVPADKAVGTVAGVAEAVEVAADVAAVQVKVDLAASVLAASADTEVVAS
ncbi:MAG: hypothetical protein FWC86_00995 [Coriobacteriia bacterium]|nr:hypothetical protein [Coriobacteriia bacterium]